MTPIINPEKFINEINERLLAVSLVQKFIIALIAKGSPNNVKIIRNAIAEILENLYDKEPNAKTFQKELKEYIDLIDNPSKDPKDIFRVIPGSQDNEPQ